MRGSGDLDGPSGGADLGGLFSTRIQEKRVDDNVPMEYIYVHYLGAHLPHVHMKFPAL